jgi:hypothetical protein
MTRFCREMAESHGHRRHSAHNPRHPARFTLGTSHSVAGHGPHTPAYAAARITLLRFRLPSHIPLKRYLLRPLAESLETGQRPPAPQARQSCRLGRRLAPNQYLVMVPSRHRTAHPFSSYGTCPTAPCRHRFPQGSRNGFPHSAKASSQAALTSTRMCPTPYTLTGPTFRS